MRVFNKKYVLEFLRYYQKRNFIAYRSVDFRTFLSRA